MTQRPPESLGRDHVVILLLPEFPSLPLVACFRNDHQNPLTEVVARAAEETAAAFALNHGQAVARLPGSGLGG